MNGVEVSVVMSVFNGAQTLAGTLASILDQQGCLFEFIVVNDGSTDATPAILDAWATRDSRLRVIHQSKNTGLTASLVRGCAQAQGEFIARQDCGDVSLSGRLERQCRFLRNHAEAVMVACAVRFVGPGHEPLFVTSSIGNDLHEGLSVLDAGRIKGPPHHGGTMFTRSAYLRAGAYRPFFTVAQDIDLWLRLRELGPCFGEAEIGYEARLESGSISARRRADQFRFAALAVECAKRRMQGLDDNALVFAPAPLPTRAARHNERVERAKFLYFIASCLRRTDPAAAKHYYWKAFREHPLLAKSLLRFLVG